MIRRTTVSVGQWVALVALAVALVFAGSVALGNDQAGAQTEPLTWHVFDMAVWDSSIITGGPVNAQPFIEQLPAECTLVPSPHRPSLFFYSCPMEWEPVHR